MGIKNDTPKVPQNPSMDLRYIRELMKGTNAALDGKLDCCGEVTLKAGAASTVVKDRLCATGSVVLLQPETASAAQEQAAGTMYWVSGSGQFTIFHANSSAANRAFRYVIIG